MTAVELLNDLTLKGVNYITPEQAAVLIEEGAVAGKETHLELPIQPGIRLLCYVKLDLSYTKVWVRDRRYRAETGRFALEGDSLAKARELYKETEEMHYRDMLGEI